MWKGGKDSPLALHLSLSLSLFSLASEPNKLGGGGGKTDMSDIHPSASVLAYPALLLGPLQPETQLPSNFSPH